MVVERAAGGKSLIDVLDRVLDKGIVLDAWARVSLVGIDLITDARIVVASIDTYLEHSGPAADDQSGSVASSAYAQLAAENRALKAQLGTLGVAERPVAAASTPLLSAVAPAAEPVAKASARPRRP